MFPGWLQDFFRMIISNERSKGTRWSPTIRWSQLFNDPQPFDDPQLSDDQLEVWTLIIQKSTVIPSSPMVLFKRVCHGVVVLIAESLVHVFIFYIGSLILERDHLNRVCCRVIVFIEQWNTRSNGAADDRPLGRDWNSGKIRRPFQNSEPWTTKIVNLSF